MQRLSRNFLREGAVIITAGLIVAVALAGCGSGKSSTTSTPNPPQATTAGSSTHAPPPEDTATNAPAPTDTPADSTATTADNCLPSGSGAGDRIQTEMSDGPFTFHIGILQDPKYKLPQVGLMPADTSYVPGVGWFYQWTYGGPDAGPYTETWGQLTGGDFPKSREGPPIGTLTSGERPERPIGIPKGVQAGQGIELAVRVEVSGQAYGVIMSLDIEASNGNLIACNPTFRAWPSTPASSATP